MVALTTITKFHNMFFSISFDLIHLSVAAVVPSFLAGCIVKYLEVSAETIDSTRSTNNLFF